MRRRTTVLGAGATSAALVAALAIGGGPAGGGDGGGEGAGGAGAAPVATAEVTRRDLTEVRDLDGTLGYGDARELVLVRAGTITALAAEGSVVAAGGVLAEVDGSPVVLLTGERAAWRRLAAGVGDGEDVRQLERNLVDLGFVDPDDLTVDDHWTAATTDAVEAMQEAVGAEQDGAVDLGEVVFAPAAVRVADHRAHVGSASGGAALEVTGTARLVTVDLDAADHGTVTAGMEVVVELPDGTTADGVVWSVADVVDPPAQEGGDPTVEVVVVFADPTVSGTVDQAPVEVRLSTVTATGALTVPVEALLALAEGGYAVERPDGSLVGVELGPFADGVVAVTPLGGTLVEGDEVVVPS